MSRNEEFLDLISHARYNPRQEQMAKIEALLKSKCISSRTKNIALWNAVQNYSVEVVELLLKYGADTEYKYENGETALIVVIKSHDEPHTEDESNTIMAIIEALIESGANVNERNHDGETALYLTAQKIYYMNLNYPDALHGSYFRNIVKLLLQHGADPNMNKEGSYISSPLSVITRKMYDFLRNNHNIQEREMEILNMYQDIIIDLINYGANLKFQERDSKGNTSSSCVVYLKRIATLTYGDGTFVFDKLHELLERRQIFVSRTPLLRIVEGTDEIAKLQEEKNQLNLRYSSNEYISPEERDEYTRQIGEIERRQDEMFRERPHMFPIHLLNTNEGQREFATFIPVDNNDDETDLIRNMTYEDQAKMLHAKEQLRRAEYKRSERMEKRERDEKKSQEKECIISGGKRTFRRNKKQTRKKQTRKKQTRKNKKKQIKNSI
jgi:hypothetical protein